jgi:hypothetical protein
VVQVAARCGRLKTMTKQDPQANGLPSRTLAGIAEKIKRGGEEGMEIAPKGTNKMEQGAPRS